MFEEEITDYKVGSDGYIERQGFVFIRRLGPKPIYDILLLNNTSDFKMNPRRFPKSNRTLEEHIKFISENKIEKIYIITKDLTVLKSIPDVKHLQIILNEDSVDYLPLYEMPKILSLHILRYDHGLLKKPVDCSKIKGLLKLVLCAKEGVNFERIETLKSLDIDAWKKKDLKELFTSKQLDTLRMLQCGIHSLEGIEQSEKMQCLYLHYNRSLKDISALASVKNTLRALRIENCPKIEDFSVLAELENLELLELTGKNTLANLEFIKKMKNLKTFIFDMNVLNGDLTPCLGLSYVYSRKNRKHYNVKDKDMPKGKYVRGNEDIELWRRME